MKTIFHRFRKYSSVSLQEEGEMLESAIFLEEITRVCFQSMNDGVNNGNVRRECQLFFKEALLTQNQLKNFLKDPLISHERFERMCRNHQVEPSHFSILGIIEIALHYALQKWNIYKYLLTNTRGADSEKTLTQALTRTWKEIKFLKNEEKFQKNKEAQNLWQWSAASGILR